MKIQLHTGHMISLNMMQQLAIAAVCDMKEHPDGTLATFFKKTGLAMGEKIDVLVDFDDPLRESIQAIRLINQATGFEKTVERVTGEPT